MIVASFSSRSDALRGDQRASNAAPFPPCHQIYPSSGFLLEIHRDCTSKPCRCACVPVAPCCRRFAVVAARSVSTRMQPCSSTYCERRMGTAWDLHFGAHVPTSQHCCAIQAGALSQQQRPQVSHAPLVVLSRFMRLAHHLILFPLYLVICVRISGLFITLI